MAAPAKKQQSDFFIDPDEVRRIIAATNERMGFVPDPTATAEQAQAMMRALGIRPEDNILSSLIIADRYEEEE
jgi:hypothetical protein